MPTRRLAHCPPGLWEVLCGILRDASEFLRDNPEVYEECKAEWRWVRMAWLLQYARTRGTNMRFLKSRSIEDRRRAVQRHLWMTHMCEFEELSENQPVGTGGPSALLYFLEFMICSYATLSPLVLEQAMLCRDAKHLEVTDLAQIAQSIAAELLDYSVIAHRRQGIELNMEEYGKWLDLSFPPEKRDPFDVSQSYTAFHKAGYTGLYEHGKWTRPRKNWRIGIPPNKASEEMALARAG